MLIEEGESGTESSQVWILENNSCTYNTEQKETFGGI